MALKIKKILEFIWQEFIYGGHLQCLGIVGIAYTSSFLLDIKVSWEFLLLTYLIFYPIYINDRLRGIKIDTLTNPERVEHFKKYLHVMPKIILTSILLLIGGLIFFSNIQFRIFALLLLLLGILYPFYFKNITKKIIAFKNFYASAFSTIMVLSPVIYYRYSLDPSSLILLLLLMILVFLKTMQMQILLDCKDVEPDKSLGLLTLPILFGREKILNFLKFFSLFNTTSILILAIFFFKLFPLSTLLLLLTIPANFYSFSLAQKQKYDGYILGSGEFFFWLILMLIGNVIL